MDWVLNLEVDNRGFVSESDRDTFFRQQFLIPENTSCFDCGFSNPNWTSLSYSIYLCLNCSGRHRQLGSHISFVRSVDMDRFTRDQLVRLSLGGNGRFNSFLNSENLLNKPLNYTHPKLLSYSAKLDSELSNYTGKSSRESNSPKNVSTESNLSNEDLSSTHSSQPLVNRNTDGGQNLDSIISSMRDDVEKLLSNNTDTFSDLLDFGSVPGHEFVTANPVGLSENTFGSVVDKNNDNSDVFENFEAPKAEKNDFKFDSVSDFVSLKPETLNKANSNDTLLNMDFTKTDPFPSPSGPAPAGKQSSLSFGTASKGFNSEARGLKNKFSSKVNDFDFESFEKQNVLQASFAAAQAQAATSSAFGGPTLGFGGSAAAHTSTSASFGSSPARFATPSFGISMPVPSSTPNSSPFAPAASPELSYANKPVSSLQSQSIASPPPGPSSYANKPTVVNEDLLSNSKPFTKPDLSQFAGKKAISSDAFFGNTAPTHTSMGNKVSPNRLAFSSDDYFGRPRREAPPVSSIEEQAMQNLNELKENIVSAINKGGVLFEKAKQWLNTNYH